MAKKPETQDDFESAPEKKFTVTVIDNGRNLMQYRGATLVKAESRLLEFVSSGAKTVMVSGTWLAEEE